MAVQALPVATVLTTTAELAEQVQMLIQLGPLQLGQVYQVTLLVAAAVVPMSILLLRTLAVQVVADVVHQEQMLTLRLAELQTQALAEAGTPLAVLLALQALADQES